MNIFKKIIDIIIIKTHTFDYLCIHQNLSEKFMEKHLDKLDWNSICINQNLSEKFMEKHLDKLNSG